LKSSGERDLAAAGESLDHAPARASEKKETTAAKLSRLAFLPFAPPAPRRVVHRHETYETSFT
jgi:hypothetical protein